MAEKSFDTHGDVLNRQSMTIDIKVIPGAKKNFAKKEGEILKIYLTAPPVEGKANKALIKFLADYYHVSLSRIEITKGLKSRFKTIKINESSITQQKAGLTC